MSEQYKKKSEIELEITKTTIDVEVAALLNLKSRKTHYENMKVDVLAIAQKEVDKLNVLIALYDTRIQEAIALGIVDEVTP